MKTLLVLLAFVLALGAGPLVRADEVAEAQKTFDLFRQYTRTDDAKLLDLFASDVSVTITINAEHGPTHDTVLPPATFRDLVQRNIDQKQGSRDTYKDVEFKPEGNTVRMTCTRVDEKTGFTGPFLVIYGQDAGQLKIKAMKFSVPPPKITNSEGTPTPTPAPTVSTPADIPVPQATP